jgi:VIT1/CCC1 family predicted Fe2+/Mn2+ transporter
MASHDHHSAAETYLRNFIFGIEDSLVSTVGLLSGIAVANVDRQTIVLTGAILIVVEAFSMGVGSLLSESSAEEYMHKRARPTSAPAWGAVIMFVSYFLSGFVPLAPYAVLERADALPVSILLSLCSLFLLGFFSAQRYGASVWRDALRMFLLGGIAIGAGIIVGRFLPR